MKKLIAGLAVLALGGCSDIPTRVGSQTQAWTDLQKSNMASSAAPRPMPGEVADKVYQRYVNSFGNPIPDLYTRDTANSGGGSSGG
ncbi:MAG TPA: DUF3613 domain-containing protein, partial [Nevskiaceae bacterium]|nr:DUF3613 domain-containing protein [Nevskiaceae bacterium]